MSTLKKASCGTMESSVVEHQFGDSIRALAADMLQQEGIDNVSLRIVDRGALECTLRARLETLIARAREAGGANA